MNQSPPEKEGTIWPWHNPKKYDKNATLTKGVEKNKKETEMKELVIAAKIVEKRKKD